MTIQSNQGFGVTIFGATGSGGGGGTPGGSNTQVQYNSSGAFAGDSGLTYDVANKALTVGTSVIAPQVYSATQTLTDGATITWNANTSAAATVTLAGTGRTLTPSNLKNGGSYTIIIKQDATGSRTITTWTNFKWPGGIVPTLSTAANAVDIVTGISDGTYIYASIQQGFA